MILRTDGSFAALVLSPAALAAVRLVPVRAAAVAALLHPVPVVGARAGAGVAVRAVAGAELPPAVAVLVPPLTPVIVRAVTVLVPASHNMNTSSHVASLWTDIFKAHSKLKLPNSEKST